MSRANTHTHSKMCTSAHVRASTHTQAHGNASEIDNSHLSPVSVISLLFPLSPNAFFHHLPIALCLYQQVLDGINQIGVQIWKLQHYGAQGLVVNIKPGEVDRTGYNRFHKRPVQVGLNMSLCPPIKT